MLARLSAFVIWALVAATAVFWGLRLLVRAPAAPAYAVAVADATAARGDLTRLLGGSAPSAAVSVTAAPEAASRFRLIGIVAPRAAADPSGVALIAVDGKMPRAFPVGATLDGDLVLQSVSLRSAAIGAAQGAAAITLELPPLTAAATGTLPVGGGPVSTPPAPLPVQLAAPVAQPRSLIPPQLPQAVPQQPQMPPPPPAQ